MTGYSSRVNQDIARWVGNGLIDATTGEALARDVEANEGRLFSFGSVLAIMAALLLGAAILLLVAANWEAIPRLVRVAGLFAIIFGGYVGGAALQMHGNDGMAQALWLIAAAAFGGSIALVGQMYHLAGDEASAVLIWCLGTGLAAAALRSGPLTVAASAIGICWMVLRGFNYWEAGQFPRFYLVVAVVLWLVSYWTQSRVARHLILLSLVFYACLPALHYDVTGVGIALAVLSAALFALAARLPEAVESLARLGGRFPVHCLIGFLVGLTLIQSAQIEESARLVVTALVTFGGIAAALYVAGRGSRLLRAVAYTGFGVELCFIYVVTISTMLGTAGLFLASGIVLGIIALVIIRVERRIKNAATGQTGAA